MTEIAPDLAQLLRNRRGAMEPDDRPDEYLWTFDPEEAKVYIDHNEHPDRHPADHITHETLAPHVHHPDTVHGYAIPIKGGWRVMTDDYKPADPFIDRRVRAALNKEHPPAPLPHVRYHGAP